MGVARSSGLQRLSMRNVASAHQVHGEFGAAEEGPSELLIDGRWSSVLGPRWSVIGRPLPQSVHGS